MSLIVVAGINGFVGQHLAKELKKQGYEVIGVGREPKPAYEIKSIIQEYYQCNLLVESDLAKLPLRKSLAVINLAGLAQVGSSFDQEQLYMNVNVKVQTILAKYIKENNISSVRILAVSTGAVYDSTQPMPLSEDSKVITEGSPYAMSKIAMENALQKYISSGMDIVIARPFNHTGPGQRKGFLIPDIADQVINSETLLVGNLKTERDYTDVRDVVKAYVMLATKPELSHRLYNICSGKSISGIKILGSIKKGLNKLNVNTVVDSKKIRPKDPLVIIGDNLRLCTDTGWNPKIEIKKTISDYIEWALKENSK